jgi:hypothetical protein
MVHKIVFLYRTGGEYDAQDVANMRWQLQKYVTVSHEVVCLSDDPAHADMLVELPYDRWWNKVEIFKLVNTPCLYLDLDVVILRNINDLIDKLSTLNTFYMNAPCGDRVEAFGDMSSSIMAWNGDYKYLFTEFTDHDLRYRGDQSYISAKLKSRGVNIGYMSNLVEVHGWKSKCSFGIPPKTKIINFYGRPRPRQLGLPYWGRHLL